VGAAARDRADTDVERMERLIEQDESTSPSLEELRLSLLLHELIATIAGNGRAAVVRGLLDETARIPWLAPGLRIYPDTSEHSKIVAAIALRDADAAAQKMAEHLEAAKARALTGLGAR
jgi:DNA-binding FadR family transcriptional regulator